MYTSNFHKVVNYQVKMSYYFPISLPMEGSVIPGPLMRVRVVRLASFPDHSNALKRRRVTDPVMKFPDMHEPHSGKHPVMQQLHKLLKGGEPEMRKGYAPFVGERNWRQA